MKSVKNFVFKNYPYILIGLFAVISGFTLFMCSDDFIWYFAFDEDILIPYRSPNGRYFSNFITQNMVHMLPVFSVFYSVTIFIFFFLMEKFVRNKKMPKNISCLLVFIFVHLIPAKTYTEVFRWISGYMNYAFPFIFTLLYLLISFKVFFEGYKPKIYYAPVFCAVGLAGGLCVEHITIYNAVFAVFAIIFTYIKRKKVLPHDVGFLIGTAVSVFLMFSHSQYSAIAKSGDSIGGRVFAASFSDILMQIYRFVLPHFTRDLWLIHIFIAYSVTLLYCRNKGKLPKYRFACLVVNWLFVFYSCFSSFYSDIAVLTTAMKGRSIEFSFTFIYICALIYEIADYFSGNECVRFYIYLFSAMFTTSPFVIVSPVTARCYFVEYMFWVMLSLEMFFASIENYSLKVFNIAISTVSAGIVFMFSNMNIANYFVNSVRCDYLHQQVEQGRKYIELIELPYQKYAFDDITNEGNFENLSKDRVSWGKYIIKYYTSSEDFEDYTFQIITYMDYAETNVY